MRIAHRLLFVGLFLLAPVCIAAGADNHPPGAGELFADGSAAYHHDQFAEAIGYLGQYLDMRAPDTSDPRLGEAQKMFTESAMGLAKERVRNHQDLVAAYNLVQEAGHAGVGDGSADMKAAAKKYLRQAETTAERHSDHQAVVELSSAWHALFPDEPPMLDDEALDVHRVAVLVQLAKLGRFDAVLGQAHSLEDDGMTDESLSKAGIDLPDIRLKWAQSLLERGWYRQSAWLCENIGASATADQTRQANKLTERALAMYVEACQKFGNPKMIVDAVGLYAADNNPLREPLKLHRYQAAADEVKSKDPEPLVVAGKFVDGKATWIANSDGFQLDHEIVIGNASNNRGGKWTNGDVTVGPGFVLDGGTLTVSAGTLTFKGLPVKPIMLRHVQINCEFGGSMYATDTIFIDCAFHKTGGWYWMNFSSKWGLTDCMLLRSNFAGLSRTDYGIHWIGTTFVDCRIPDRQMTRSAHDDGAKEYHDDWNKIVNCIFSDCTVAPSALWGGMPAICYDCTVNGTSSFNSATSLTVPIALPSGDSGFIDQLMVGTAAGGSGTIAYQAGPARGIEPSPQWWALPDIGDADSQGEK